jgi:hypothetical protein
MQSSDLFKQLERHVRSASDVELLLLKGHLVLEQVLNDLLGSYFAGHASADQLGLTFSKKIDLVAALHPGKSLATELKYLREINRIRNKLAHSLEFSDYHTDLKRWACSVVEYTPKTIDRLSTYRNTVLKAFYLLAAFISGSADGIRIARTSVKANKSFKPNPLRGSA